MSFLVYGRWWYYDWGAYAPSLMVTSWLVLAFLNRKENRRAGKRKTISISQTFEHRCTGIAVLSMLVVLLLLPALRNGPTTGKVKSVCSMFRQALAADSGGRGVGFSWQASVRALACCATIPPPSTRDFWWKYHRIASTEYFVLQ